jgi:4,5-DOPA dioxygenase extradiol
VTPPVLFVSHGAPSLVLESTPTRAFLEELARSFERPRAVICVTAHWETARPSVSLAETPEMIYDFYGFPDELYRVSYPAPGDPALARRILDSLKAAGIEAEGDPARGFDHGVWSPLVLMLPDAGVPVVPISVQPRLDAAHHFAIGKALAPLRDEGVLILGSGSFTHNLREVGRKPAEHTVRFEEWLSEALESGRSHDLVAWETKAPYAVRNHPTPEHLLPLFVALGAANGAEGRVLNRHFEYGSLSMAACQWV